jgi:hypothetical protein
LGFSLSFSPGKVIAKIALWKKHATRKGENNDVQSQEVHKAFKEADHLSTEKGSTDAINRSRGPQEEGPVKRPGFQPGQEGEQIGGHGKKPSEGQSGEQRAAHSTTDKGFLGTVRDFLGIGSKREFHRSALLAQHQAAGEDEGERIPKPKEQKPSWVGRPEESHILVSTSQPSAEYTHVKGTPEPDSYRRGYEYVHGKPSGILPRSSTSTDPPHTSLPFDHPRNPEGVGLSSAMIRESADAAANLQTEKGTIHPKQTETL